MPTPNRPRARRTVARLFVAAGVGLAVPAPAWGFYFDFGPGSGVTPPKWLTSPLPPGPGKPPDDTLNPPSGREPPPPWVPPPDTPNPPTDRPPGVPEPASGVAALLGLAAVGVGRRLKRHDASG